MLCVRMNLKCGISSDSTSVVILNELLLFYFARSKAYIYIYYSSVLWPQQSSPEHDLCKMRMETAMGKSQYDFAVTSTTGCTHETSFLL